MEDDYDDDELPPISVSTSQDESVFAMPSAEVLATQRAREEQCERQLLQLKARHEQHEAASRAAVNGGPAMPLRSDSSGSETETVLASAVEALRVGSSAERGGARARPAARDLLAAALPHAAGALCQDYLRALQQGSAGDVDALTDDMLSGIGSWLCELTAEAGPGDRAPAAGPGDRAPTDDEVLGVGTWLCAAVLWRAPRQHRARTTRALHALLAAATEDQVRALARLAARSWRAGALRLELSAAGAAAGPEPRAAQFAAALSRAALTDLLADSRPTEDAQPAPLSLPELAELCARGWRGVPGAERDAALQLLGRALAAAKRASDTSAPSDHDDRAALARALAALAQPLSHTQADRHRPDLLKIAVAASKLQILLSDRK